MPLLASSFAGHQRQQAGVRQPGGLHAFLIATLTNHLASLLFLSGHQRQQERICQPGGAAPHDHRHPRPDRGLLEGGLTVRHLCFGGACPSGKLQSPEMRSARTAAQRATLHCLQGFCSSPSSACSPLLHFSTLGPTSPASGLLGDCAAQAHLHLSTPSCALLLTAASGVIFLAGLLGDCATQAHLHLQRPRAGAAHLGTARNRCGRPARAHRLPG